ncbi:MAG: DUF692 family multinuclear iron-containing protein [Thiogranum sp.]
MLERGEGFPGGDRHRGPMRHLHHGADVVDSVWNLLDRAYAHFGVVPTLLERDFNIPPLPGLLGEVDRIAALQAQRAPDVASTYAGHN